MSTALQKRIMRRVYYSYLLSVVVSGAFMRGVVLGACVALFGRLTHVAALIHNFLSVPLGNIPEYVGGAFSNALLHGELFTVLVVVTMAGVSISFIGQMVRTMQWRMVAA